MRNYLTEQELEAITDAIGCTCCASLDKAVDRAVREYRGLPVED